MDNNPKTKLYGIWAHVGMYRELQGWARLPDRIKGYERREDAVAQADAMGRMGMAVYVKEREV